MLEAITITFLWFSTMTYFIWLQIKEEIRK